MFKKKDKETIMVNGEEIELPDRPRFFTWRNLEEHVVSLVSIFGIYCVGLLGSHLILGSESIWVVIAIGLPLLGLFARTGLRHSREEVQCQFKEVQEKINEELINAYEKKCVYLMEKLDEHGIDYSSEEREEQ